MSIQLAPGSRQSPCRGEVDKTALNTTPSKVGSQARGERKAPLRCPCAPSVGPQGRPQDCAAEPAALRGGQFIRKARGSAVSWTDDPELLRRLRGNGHTGHVSWGWATSPHNEQPQAVELDGAWSSWVRGAAGSSRQALCLAWHRWVGELLYLLSSAHPPLPPGATPPGSQTEAV